jgi:hypothetical protein
VTFTIVPRQNQAKFKPKFSGNKMRGRCMCPAAENWETKNLFDSYNKGVAISDRALIGSRAFYN